MVSLVSGVNGTETESLDWHLLDDGLHRGVENLVRDLNKVYAAQNSLWR